MKGGLKYESCPSKALQRNVFFICSESDCSNLVTVYRKSFSMAIFQSSSLAHFLFIDREKQQSMANCLSLSFIVSIFMKSPRKF